MFGVGSIRVGEPAGRDPGMDNTNGRPAAKGPRVEEQCATLAEAGDVEGVWRLLSGAGWGVDLCAVCRSLFRACEVGSRTDPAAFADRMFTRMVAFLSQLLLRSEYFIVQHLSQDPTMRGQGCSTFSHDVETHIL